MNKQNNSRCSAEVYLKDFEAILSEMIKGMTEAKLTESISHNFIVQMIPHHRAAIEMSESVLKYTRVTPLRKIAENIISEQTKSISDMEKILKNCSEKANSQQELSDYGKNVDAILKTMFSEMKNAYSDCHISCDFMREMIPHHMGAVRMSKNALAFPICGELVPVLEAIISSQEKGICQMKCLLKCLNCKQ